ncbi:MAG TPA: tagaturonate reductase [Gemmatimonadales bacterium]|nr:tagaturonate reductase [Gemmatimonadales bacterium]
MQPITGDLPSLGPECWPNGAYPRARLPERVLQFGTGMLLRAVCGAAVDAANRLGRFNGRILVVQSTPHGAASAMNAQDGLFTLVERGVVDGAPVERMRLVGAISRALRADTQWAAVCEAVARPELQVVVSNVTEAGFRPDDPFPTRLTDLLHTRFTRLPAGPPLFVIPTELVPNNGTRIAEMVEQRAPTGTPGKAFRAWLASNVRFCSSLVDRITTGLPAPAVHAELEARLGYHDALLTITEPHCLWAVATDPAALAQAFPIAAPPTVMFAPNIGFYSERKLRLLNGAHTAVAPLAILAGVATVRTAAEHPRLGPFLRRILFDEIVPSTDLPADAATAFARSVVDRFRNPWIEHAWQVIATNQTAKVRVRVLPSVTGFVAARGRVPSGLVLAYATYLRFMRCVTQLSLAEGRGWWRGESYPIHDVDLPILAGHWAALDPDRGAGPVPTPILERLAARVLSDTTLWGTNLASIPGFAEATTSALRLVEECGVDAAVEALGPVSAR